MGIVQALPSTCVRKHTWLALFRNESADVWEQHRKSASNYLYVITAINLTYLLAGWAFHCVFFSNVSSCCTFGCLICCKQAEVFIVQATALLPLHLLLRKWGWLTPLFGCMLAMKAAMCCPFASVAFAADFCEEFLLNF